MPHAIEFFGQGAIICANLKRRWRRNATFATGRFNGDETDSAMSDARGVVVVTAVTVDMVGVAGVVVVVIALVIEVVVIVVVV